MGLNYIGSKHSLLGFLESSMNKVVEGQNRIFCDLFAGTGAVAEHFKKKGYSVIANDLQYYSYVINKHRIGNHKPLKFAKLRALRPQPKNILADDNPARLQAVCDLLNKQKPVKGFIYKNYSPTGSNNQRSYFSDATSMSCDAIRQTIKAWRSSGQITKAEYYFLLCSLLESVDKYANTASVYGAFLKTFKTSALKQFKIEPVSVTINKQTHKVYNQDINQLVKQIKGDIVYLDPPYNHRQYSANYHMLETIALYDNPQLKGKTGMRIKENKSLYCSRTKVLKTFEDLINNIKARYIFLSYNNEGLMKLSDIKRIMSQRGQYGVFVKTYKRYKADSKRYNKTDQTKEYLHYVVCSQQQPNRH